MLQLPYLLEASLIVAFGCILYKVFLEKEKSFHWNRGFLLSIMMFSFILPLLSIPLFSEKLYVVLGAVDSPSDPIIASNVNWSQWVQGFYLVVTFILLLRVFLAYFQLWLAIRYSQVTTLDGNVYHVSDEIHVPSSFFGYIFIPNGDIPKEVIEHEKVHVRHKHSFDILFIQLAKAFQWFNPFIYLLEKFIKENHEYTADHQASIQLNGPSSFSEFLLSYASNTPNKAILNTFSSSIKKRILMLSNPQNKKDRSLRPLLMLPFLIGILMLFSFDSYPKYYSAETGVLLDSIPRSYLDTIATFNKEGKEVAQVVRIFPDELIEFIDTVTTFDFENYEEKIMHHLRKEPKMIIVNENLSGLEFYDIMDTTIVFDLDQQKETIQYSKRRIPKLKKKK